MKNPEESSWGQMAVQEVRELNYAIPLAVLGSLVIYGVVFWGLLVIF